MSDHSDHSSTPGAGDERTSILQTDDATLTGVVRILGEWPMSRGTNGLLYRGVLSSSRLGDVDVVVKVYTGHADGIEHRLCRRTCDAWKELKHPRILPLLCVCTFPGLGHWSTNRSLVTRFIEKGDLMKNLPDFSPRERQQRMFEISEALEWLHEEAGVVHGDIRFVSRNHSRSHGKAAQQRRSRVGN